MAAEKRVSGMTVGPMLSEETHDAIVATRKRRKQVSKSGAAKRSSTSSQQSGEESDAPQSES